MIVWQRRSGITVTLDGARLSELRMSRDMTRRQLAEHIGCTVTTISNWENEECCPSLPQITRLRGVFGDALAECGAVEVVR